jgi:prevent-host-death family protein
MTVKVEHDRLVKISDLHTDTSKWIQVSQEGPLFILRHGTPAAVLIGVEAFEELLDRVRLKTELERRQKQSRRKTTLEELEERYARAHK